MAIHFDSTASSAPFCLCPGHDAQGNCGLIGLSDMSLLQQQDWEDLVFALTMESEVDRRFQHEYHQYQNKQQLYRVASDMSIKSESMFSTNSAGSFTSEADSEIKSVKRKQSSSPREKKGKKAKLEQLSKSTPKFIQNELDKTTGSGEFCVSEIVIMLYFAYRFFDDFDVYSKVRSCMNFRRSRASIRRKVEKLVNQELKSKGGLLVSSKTRDESKETCLKKFWEITDEMCESDDRAEEMFAVKLQNEAVSWGVHRPASCLVL